MDLIDLMVLWGANALMFIGLVWVVVNHQFEMEDRLNDCEFRKNK